MEFYECIVRLISDDLFVIGGDIRFDVFDRLDEEYFLFFLDLFSVESYLITDSWPVIEDFHLTSFREDREDADNLHGVPLIES